MKKSNAMVDTAQEPTQDTGGYSESLVGIGAVERDTGLSKDTLRVWEKRYGFPTPARDAFGERAYAREVVERLRTIKRLMDVGHRPGKIVGKSARELEAMSRATDTVESIAGAAAELAPYLDLVRTHQVEELRRLMGREVVRGGLGHFVLRVVAPLNVAIGEAWMRGALEVFEEHLYTESLQIVMRGAIANVPQRPLAPRVLLTTFPHEQHGLGLLMAEAMLVLEGAHCISLGTQTPIHDIVLGAKKQMADVVALSFSLAYPVAQAVDGLANLRVGLPPETEIWAGGNSPALARRLRAGVRAIRDLQQLQRAVVDWRATAASGQSSTQMPPPAADHARPPTP